MTKTPKITKVAGLEITNPEKLLFEEDKITKLDVVKYYEKIAPYILPELKNRPVSLVRSPQGIEYGKFYQKHPQESFPDYIERVKIQEKEKIDTYITLDEVNDLVYLANIDVLEFHTWNATVDDLEHPDRTVWDFDPSEDVPWKVLVKGALALKEILEKLSYTPTVKTSGNKGLHVIITPFTRTQNWETCKAFAKSIAQEVVELYPNEFTLDLPKELRKGKVFIDYLRNERGSTTVAAYSLRAKPGAPISFPIKWSNLLHTKPNKYNIKNVFKFLK